MTTKLQCQIKNCGNDGKMISPRGQIKCWDCLDGETGSPVTLWQLIKEIFGAKRT